MEPSLCHGASDVDDPLSLTTRSDRSDLFQNSMSPQGLTEASVNAAFGYGASMASRTQTRGSVAGASRAPGASVRVGGIIMPTSKEGSDSVSMYSMSQSVLPMDPRERIYYRPRRHLLQCYLERRQLKDHGIKGLLSPGQKSFHFFLDHTDEFVLAAVPRSLPSHVKVEDTSDGVGGRLYSVPKGGSNIVFTTNGHQLDGDARSFVGRLARRGHGMEMVMFSEGSKASRKEIVAVLMNNFGDTGGCSFTVVLPAIDPDSGYIKPLEGGEVKFLRDGRGGTSVAGGSRLDITEALGDSSSDDLDEVCSTMTRSAPSFPTVCDSLNLGDGPVAGGGKAATDHGDKQHPRGVLAREYERNPRSPNIIVLKSKTPQWDGVLRGYKLDFHGRATKASGKNFQLVAVSDPGKVVMLFGKQGSDRFALDFRYPLCGLQAAAIATTIMTARTLIP